MAVNNFTQDDRRTLAAARENAEPKSRLSERTIELDDDEDSRFLRTEKRVPVRRAALPKKARNLVKLGFIIAGVLMLLCMLGVRAWSSGPQLSGALFVSGCPRNHRDGAAIVARGGHENFQPSGARTGFRRRKLFAGAQRSGPLRPGERESHGERRRRSGHDFSGIVRLFAPLQAIRQPSG